jgi:hypothetical protein
MWQFAYHLGIDVNYQKTLGITLLAVQIPCPLPDDPVRYWTVAGRDPEKHSCGI